MSFEEDVTDKIKNGWPKGTAIRLAKIDEIKNHNNLDEYIKDEDETVRQYVAYQGYKLNALALDKSILVKRTVLKVATDMFAKTSNEFLEIYDSLKEDSSYDIRIGIERLGMWVKYPTNQEERKKVYFRTLEEQINNFQEIPKDIDDIFAILFIDMDDSLRLNMAKNSKDFETLILLSYDSSKNEITEIAKERAESLEFFIDKDKIEFVMKKHFK